MITEIGVDLDQDIIDFLNLTLERNPQLLEINDFANMPKPVKQTFLLMFIAQNDDQLSQAPKRIAQKIIKIAEKLGLPHSDLPRSHSKQPKA